MKTIYFSLVYPHLQYGVLFWGGVCQTEFDKIFCIQKKIIRLIANVGQYAHTDPLFKQFSILKLTDVKKLEECKFIAADLNIHNNFGFEFGSDIHSYSTRNSDAIILPQPTTDVLKRSVFYEGVKCFNELSSDIKVFHCSK